MLKFENIALFAKRQDKLYKLTSAGSNEVPNLYITLEVYCRLLQHAGDAANEGCEAAMITLGDTDVFILFEIAWKCNSMCDFSSVL